MPLRKRKFSSSASVLAKRARMTRAIIRSNPQRFLRPGWKKRLSKSRIGLINVHSFRRWAATDQRLSGTGGTGYADVFTLDKLPQYTEFDTLYDRYMITSVVVKFQLISNPDSAYFPGSSTTVNADNWYPKLWYYTDYDDNTAPTSLDDVKQVARAKHVVLRPNKEIKVVVKPAILAQTYRTSTSTGYAPVWKQWVDIANVDVPHYGLKYWMDRDWETRLHLMQII